jgi:hypothetical protein
MTILRRFPREYAFPPEWIRCRLVALLRPILRLPPSLDCWLRDHPNVAGSIKWQFMFQSSAYDVPEAAIDS